MHLGADGFPYNASAPPAIFQINLKDKEEIKQEFPLNPECF